MARFRKTDVEHHSDSRRGRPAVNVKVHRLPYHSRIEETFGCSEDVAQQALDYAWKQAQQMFWETVQGFADEFLGADRKVYQEGKSGGWVVVHGLYDIEEWDAIQLMDWYRFQKAIKTEVKWLTSWEQMKESIQSNRWAEEGSQYYNFLDKKDGRTVCMVDV